MRRLPVMLALILAPGFASAEASADAADTDISAEQMLRQFDDVIFGQEHGVSNGILLRWTTAPSIGLFVARDYDGEPPIGRVEEVLGEINGLTGLSATRTAQPEESTLRLGFFPRRDFAALSAAAGANQSEYIRFVTTSACLGLAKSSAQEPGTLEAGLIMIGSDISTALQRHCILEELVQVMGMPNDACNYQPSVFCEDDHVEHLTKADRILVRTLYDSRMINGMPRELALLVANVIIRELLDELP